MPSVPPGGPSTIRGVLYQMLWCLLRATRLYVPTPIITESNDRVAKVLLRLEPLGGGGDVQEIGEESRMVAQLKARADRSSWSLRQVIEDVLPDLYLAIDGGPKTKYCFITEGSMGQWSEVYRFFQSLERRTPATGGLLDELDDTIALPFRGTRGSKRTTEDDSEPFWSRETYTERTLFDHIVEVLRNRPMIATREASLEIVQRNTWHLLANFEFIGGQTEEHLREEVDSLLLALVNFDTEVIEKREAMLAGLAGRCIQGGSDIESCSFLAEYGLDSVPLTDWQTLRARSGNHVSAEARRRGHESSEDVRRDLAQRAIAGWADDAPILILSGDSGQGKSWLASALARELTRKKELVVFIESAGDAERDLCRAADVFWRVIKRNDTGPSLDRIADRRRHLIHRHADRWLTVVIDGVQDGHEARELSLAGWEEWGVRAVVTCQPEVTRVFERVSRKRTQAFPVDDFTVPELQEYLTGRLGDAWSKIPNDVRDTLRRPLLAQLYWQVVGNHAWWPTNEYELYAAYWLYLQEDDRGVRPLDMVGLARLSKSLLDGATYPWAAAQLQKAGLDNDAIDSLIRRGVLRRTPEGDFAIWHQRILNWSVAQGLVAALRTGEIDRSLFCKRLQNLFAMHGPHVDRRLGYVPMDALWMLAGYETAQPELLDHVLATLANTGWREAEILYAELLPTLGPRIVPALYRRLAEVSLADPVSTNQLVRGIITFPEDVLADHTARLLHSESRLAQRAALKILAQRPVARLLDKVWDLHCGMQARPADYLRPEEQAFLLYDESFGALKAGVHVDRGWLERAVRRANPDWEPVYDLAYLLASLTDACGLWQSVKPILFEKVGPSRPRALAANCYAHRDESEVEWLLGQVPCAGDILGAVALRALIRIAPDIAVEHFHELPESELCLTRDWCFAELLARKPEATLARFRDLLIQHAEPRRLATVFQGAENSLDRPSIEVLLDDLERVLDADLAGQTPPHQATVWFLCSVLAKAYSLGLLGAFEQRRGSTLEDKLTTWLLKRGARRSLYSDPEVQAPREVLYKIGGKGFTRVVNACLESDSQYGRLDGIQLAAKRPDEETVKLLIRISVSDRLWDGNHSVEQGEATKALGALGRLGDVAESILHWGLRTLKVVSDQHVVDTEMGEAIAQTCLRELASGDRAIGAALALGVFGSAEHSPYLREILSKTDLNSPLALACIISLGRLRDQTDEAVRQIEQHLTIQQHRYAATVALLRIGTDAALARLAAHLESHYDTALAIDFMQSSVRSKKATEATRKYLASAEPWEWGRTIVSLARHVDAASLVRSLVDEGRVFEHLHDLSFAAEGTVWLTGSKADAILGLARFDPRTAFLAALRALQNPNSHDRNYYPYVLAEIDKNEAVPRLMEHAVSERSTGVIWAIGRVLSGLNVEAEIEGRLSSTDADKRFAACRVCARLRPAPALIARLERCLDDLELRIARAARESLTHLLLAREAEILLNAVIAEQDSARRWVLLDALIAIADPGDKHHSWPTWVARVAEHLPYFVRHYLQSRLEKRWDEVADEAKRRDK